MRTSRFFLTSAAALVLVFGLAACDAADPGVGPNPVGPDDIPPITGDQQAIVAQAFQEVEDLFALGFGDGAGAGAQASAQATVGAATASIGSGISVAMAPMAFASVDTTTYTGVYDATNTKGYLLTMQYRQPQGVGVWTARVQHARAVDHDGDGGASTPALDAVESVTLTFITYAALDAFVTALDGGTIPYLVGTSDDAEASFSTYDTWRVSQVFAPVEGEAVVTYANAELRESYTVRDPVVTRNSDGTGTVRDGGAAGAVRTRYYGADFTVAADGTISGTLLRTLLTSGDTADGSVVSRSDYPDASFRQTKQRGGDGVVIRENTAG